MAHRLLRPCRGALIGLIHRKPPKPAAHGGVLLAHHSSSRNYIAAEMRKVVFEGNLLRLIRNEIEYETDISPPSQHPTEFNMFAVDEKPGEEWIRLKRKYGETEEINVDVTMFDATVSAKKTGGATDDDGVKLHITMVVNVFKECNNVLECVCSVWPESIQIRKVFTRARDRTTSPPYVGPKFEDFSDELQQSLYDFLEVRGITDDLAVFLHDYMHNKDKTEYTRWMGSVKSYIEKMPKK